MSSVCVNLVLCVFVVIPISFVANVLCEQKFPSAKWANYCGRPQYIKSAGRQTLAVAKCCDILHACLCVGAQQMWFKKKYI